MHGCAGLVYWKPATPGQRHKITLDYEALGVYTGPPVPSLSLQVPRSGGRDHTGRLRVRGRGGGEQPVLRVVDYDRSDLEGATGVIQRIEHDPNRSGFLALTRYERGGVVGGEGGARGSQPCPEQGGTRGPRRPAAVPPP